jgi:hypothetical protein
MSLSVAGWCKGPGGRGILYRMKDIASALLGGAILVASFYVVTVELFCF